MLNIYTNIKEFEAFIVALYEELYEQKAKYEEIVIDFDTFILNKEKYIVEDIQTYLEFYKYKPVEKERKLSIINNFDLIDIKSQNKLLKLFEENKENHILVTDNLNKVLSTIKSRAVIYDNNKDSENFETYPKRYWDILRLIKSTIQEDEIDFYLKVYDFLIAGQYKQAYIKVSKVEEYDEQALYEIIQETHKKIGDTNSLLELQQRLFTKTNKKLQIENYLLQRIKLNGSN